jgi:glycosyltransferase involved in cell wall biosynthesis
MGPPRLTLPPTSEFLQRLEVEAARFPYRIVDPHDVGLGLEQDRLPGLDRKKGDWHFGEILAYGTENFAVAAVAALRGRAPTDAERTFLDREQRPWARLAFVLELDRLNRLEGRAVRLRGVDRARRMWTGAQWIADRRLGPLQALSSSIYRKYARHVFAASSAAPPEPPWKNAHETGSGTNAGARGTTRKKVVIANFYPVWPVMTGGQRRIFFLARELAKVFDVEIVVPTADAVDKKHVFGATFAEIRVAKEDAFRALEMRVSETAPMTADVAYAMHWDACRRYQDVLTQRLADADIAVTSHPYSIHALLAGRGCRTIPVVYDAHNVEVDQKAAVLKDRPALLTAVREAERLAVQQSALTVACSADDADTLAREYDLDRSAIRIVENGVDAAGVPVVSTESRQRVRAKLGIDGDLVAVFGGAYHYPNFRAVEHIAELARQLPHVAFVIVGSICRHVGLQRSLAANVVLLGEVDESTKWLAYQISDVALNPMADGSGTNIKMFEYAAAGLCVLTSPFGMRGVDVALAQHFIVREIADFGPALQVFSNAERGSLETMGRTGRAGAAAAADWSGIGRRYAGLLQTLLDEHAPHER